MVMADRCRKMVTGRMAVLEHRHGSINLRSLINNQTYNRKVQNVNKSNNLSESTGKTVNEKTSRFRLIFLSFYCMFDII